jgi:SAM-dependent methyltransferase
VLGVGLMEQDLRMDGKTISRGTRECETRFRLIEQALPPYTRPWTLLDLGAAGGYFGIRFAERDGCCAVMIDEGDALLPNLTANALPLTIGLRRHLTEADLEALADCEHLDVVLALNVLHDMPDPGRALRAVLRMGEEVFVEVPHDIDGLEWFGDLVRAQEGAIHLGRTRGGDLFHLRRPKSTLTWAYLGAEKNGAPPMRMHQIVSTPEIKLWNCVEKTEARVWFPGINLHTYLTLGGVYPPRARVATIVEREVNRALFGQGDVGLIGVNHADVRPWNVVLSGETATLIDWADPRQPKEDDRLALTTLVASIRGGVM